MQVFRRATVLVLLGLSLGTSGAYAAAACPEVRPQAARSAADRIGSWWNLVMTVWTKAGCVIDPWGRCAVSPASQTPHARERCRIDPLGRCVINPATQGLNAEEGCAADPWGRCLTGH
jgi:hypothetical protein